LKEQWRIYGATEAARSILEEFFKRARSSRSWGELLGAIDYLYRACESRPYSSLLINASRDIFQDFLLSNSSNSSNVSDAIASISASISRVFEMVRNMTLQAALMRVLRWQRPLRASALT
jgi:hypothetical protein